MLTAGSASGSTPSSSTAPARRPTSSSFRKLLDPPVGPALFPPGPPTHSPPPPTPPPPRPPSRHCFPASFPLQFKRRFDGVLPTPYALRRLFCSGRGEAMKKIVLALLAALALVVPASAEICTIDDVPAATLLLPYFEVSLDQPAGWGKHTLFSINNASNVAAVAHVTLWTDQSIPTLDFDVYLTGYDVQTTALHALFAYAKR